MTSTIIMIGIIALGVMTMIAEYKYRVVKSMDRFVPEKLCFLFFWSRFDDLSFATERDAMDWCKQQLDALGAPDIVWRN